jgi:hypothetical protein
MKERKEATPEGNAAQTRLSGTKMMVARRYECSIKIMSKQRGSGEAAQRW